MESSLLSTINSHTPFRSSHATLDSGHSLFQSALALTAATQTKRGDFLASQVLALTVKVEFGPSRGHKNLKYLVHCIHLHPLGGCSVLNTIRPASSARRSSTCRSSSRDSLSQQRLSLLWLLGHHPLLSQKALRHSSSAKKLHKQTQRAIQRQRSNAAALKRQHGFPRGRPTHTNGCGKVRRRKVLRKERKDRKGRLKGHFDMSTAS